MVQAHPKASAVPANADREQQRARFLARCEAAAEAESVRARAIQWRDVPLERRAEIGAGLMRMAAEIARTRPNPYHKPPLQYPQLPATK